jgi:beta-galactosidase
MPLQLGVCDYPEQVSPEQWITFPKRMEELGLSLVRVGEFAWSKLEPRAGHYEFEWLDQVVDALHNQGLQTVLGTPTATPPAWLVRAHPEILPVDIAGRVRGFGSRRHYDYSSDLYWHESARIVEALAKRYGNHPGVIGWQTDNEHGGHDTTRSYSPAALEKFRLWLSAKFLTIESLNEAWGTSFWSQAYNSFQEIGLPNLTVTEPNPSQTLDFYRFSSDQLIAYDQMQTKILRQHSPGRFVTHNFMGFFSDFDHFKAAEHLDFVSWDAYPTGILEMSEMDDALKTDYARTGHPDLISFNHDLYRGLKNGKSFWIMEQQCGQINWASHNPLPADGAVKLWTLQAVAHGADTVAYFRWQAARAAQELMHSGLLRHDGTPDRGALELARFAPQLRFLNDAAIQNKIVLLHDYECLWAYDLQSHSASASYWAQTRLFYSGLRGLGLDVDIRHPNSDLTGYGLVIAPALNIISSLTAANLERAVQNGAYLILGARTGFKTPNGGVWEPRAPGPLADLAGVRVQNFDALRPGLVSKVEAFDQKFETHTWNESLEVMGEDVTVLGRYFDDPLYSQVALTERIVGAGAVMYAGFWSERLIERIFEHACIRTGIRTLNLEKGLRISRRGGLVYAQNWSRGGIPLSVPEDTEFVIGSSLLQPHGVSVYRDSPQDVLPPP